MAWRRDPITGEWEMIDPNVPDPMTQSTTGQEPNPALRDPMPMPSHGGEGYSDPGMRHMPMPPGEGPRPEYTAPPDNAGGYSDPDLEAIPLSPPGAGAYNNYDYAAIDRWVQEVQARGNEVRKTAAGTFEVDSGGRIVSQMPSPYPVN